MWVPKYNSSEMWVPLKDTIKNTLLLQTILVEIQCHEMFGTTNGGHCSGIVLISSRKLVTKKLDLMIFPKQNKTILISVRKENLCLLLFW